MNLSLVPVHNIDQVWPSIAEGMHRACMKTGGDCTAGDIWQQCRAGSAFLVIAHDEAGIHGASAWRPETWATGAKLRCLALYGRNMSGWISQMHETVKKIARDCGADSLVSEGRAGWAKIFPRARQVRVLYEETL